MMSVLRGLARIFASLALFILIRAFVVEMFKIPTPSMQGTLMVGDFLVVDKVGYGPEIPFTGIRLPPFRYPERGDIVVFKWPSDPSVNFVKRIVGMPGDTLYMEEGGLFRNGEQISEPFVLHSSPDTDPSTDAFGWQRNHLVGTLHASRAYWPSRNNWGPLVVPERNYFVLGDNRDNSLDSRYWGFVPDSLVRGRPLMVYFSYEPDTASHFSWLTHARWRRFGTIVR